MSIKALVFKEMREVRSSRALWSMMIVLSILVGFSFVEAVHLYGSVTKSFLGEEMATTGMSPLDGVFVPTFSSLYIAVTFLFPFVAIRVLGAEKQFGTLKLLLQVVKEPWVIILIKTAVIMLFWLLCLIPALSAVAIWNYLGGHLYLPELMPTVVGHFLYALLVTAIAFFAVAVTESPQTAAIVTLTFTISSWVLEFSATNPGPVRFFSFLSMTAALRQFESGLFSLPVFLGFLVAAATLLALASVWMVPGLSLPAKLKSSVCVGVAGIVLGFFAHQSFISYDLSEGKINSFSPETEAVLRKLDKPLKITIYLNPEDSAALDMEKDFFSKLRRVIRHLTVVWVKVPDSEEFGKKDDKYGSIEYDYNGVRLQSRTIGGSYTLSALGTLAGESIPGNVKAEYSGWPAELNADSSQIWFFVVLPLLIALGWHASNIEMRKNVGGLNEK